MLFVIQDEQLDFGRETLTFCCSRAFDRLCDNVDMRHRSTNFATGVSLLIFSPSSQTFDSTLTRHLAVTLLAAKYSPSLSTIRYK